MRVMIMPSFVRTLGCAVLALMSGGTMANSVGYGLDTRGYNLAHGRVVFQSHCMRCHDKGGEGAPIFENPDAWSTRIDQPLSVLIEHAIQGHGDMPPRGNTGLADQEVAAAVAFVSNRAKILLGRQVVAEPVHNEPLDNVVIKMFLLLIGKERWK